MLCRWLSVVLDLGCLKKARYECCEAIKGAMGFKFPNTQRKKWVAHDVEICVKDSAADARYKRTQAC
jgi:hypothetical protein